MRWQAKWLKPATDMGDICPIFAKNFSAPNYVKNAKLYITALGVYEATLNGKRIGDFILAPDWTSYSKRLQYQEYDVTELLTNNNQLLVTVGKGWYRGRLGWTNSPTLEELRKMPAELLVQLEILYEDGTTATISSDETWTCGKSNVCFSEIYDGETYDASFMANWEQSVQIFDGPFSTLIKQQGEEVHEQERIQAACIFHTPKGELVIDFGQELFYQDNLDPKFEYVAKQGLVHNLGLTLFLIINNTKYTDEQKHRFAVYIVARYGAYPIVYNLGGEAPGYRDSDVDIWNGIGEAIKNADGYNNLRTVHDMNTRPLPTIFDNETWYEGIYSTEYPGRRIVPELLVRQAAYRAMQKNCCGFSYGVQGIWNARWNENDPGEMTRKLSYFGLTDWRTAIDFPGADQLTYMKEFYQSVPWNKLQIKTNMFEAVRPFVQVNNICITATEDMGLVLAYFPDSNWSTMDTFKNIPEGSYIYQVFDTSTGGIFA